MPILSLTDKGIRALPTPDTGQVTYWDKSLSGFGVRVSQGGTRTFIVMLGTSRRRVTIGKFPIVSLSDARKQAKTLIAEETLGKFRPARTAWDSTVSEFLAEHGRSERTRADYKRLLAKHFPFGMRSVADITSREIAQMLSKLNHTPSEKHHAFRVVRTLFRYCIRQGIVETSPVQNMQLFEPQPSRARVLTEQELHTLYKATECPQTGFKTIVRLLILTGQRKGEISRLQWDWIHDKTITLPATLTKNRREHTFPLCPLAKETIDTVPRLHDTYLFPASRTRTETTTVFNGFSKAKAQLDRDTGLTGYTLHDIRRTVATNLQRLGVRLEVTEAMLNHVSGTQSGIVGIYQRHKWTEEMREALLLWETFLSTLKEPKA